MAVITQVLEIAAHIQHQQRILTSDTENFRKSDVVKCLTFFVAL